MSPRSRKALICVLMVALGVRVAYILEAQANPMHLVPQMDAGYHLEWARALLNGEDYHPGPFFRAPLYPWLLASALWLTRGALLPILLLQALLGTATTWLTHDLARRAFPRTGSTGPLIAASLVALNWVLVYFDGELLLPSLGIPLQLLALRESIRLETSPTRAASLRAGLAWGVAALVRPNCLLFVALLVLWKLAKAPRSPAAALLLGVGALCPILPITAYNASKGDAVLISSQAGINLWIGNNPHSDGTTAVVPDTRPDWWGGHLDANHQAEQALGRALRPSEISSYFTGRTLDWAREDPGAFLSHLLYKARLFVSHRELGNNADIHYAAHNYSSIMRTLPPSFAILLALGLTGFAFGLWRRELAPTLPAFFFLYALSVIAFFVCARYRAPLLPILAIGAGHYIAWSLEALRSGRRQTPLLLSVLALGLGTMSLSLSPGGSENEAPGRWQLGVAALQAGDPEAAIIHLRESLDETPTYWYAWRDLGRAHLDLGELQYAEDALRSGLSIRPHEPWIADLLGDVLFQAKRADELESLATSLLSVHPNHATAHYHLARAHLLRGEDDQVREAVNAGLSVDPGNFQCLFLSARSQGASGNLDAACVRISAALRAAVKTHDADLVRMATDEKSRLGCP